MDLMDRLTAAGLIVIGILLTMLVILVAEVVTEPVTTENKTNVCEDSCTTHWYYHAGLKMMQPYIVCNECEE